MALTLAQLVAVGSDAFVARRLELGEDITDIRVTLAQQFPEAGGQTIFAAYFRGVDAFRAGREFGALGDAERIPASHVPEPIGGNLNWRYGAVVRFGAPGQGIEDVRHVYISGLGSITAGEARGRIEAMAMEMLDDMTGNKHYIPDAPKKVFLGAEVYMVSRY